MGSDEKHLNRRKVKTTKKPTPISKSVEIPEVVQTHRHPGGCSWLLPKSAEASSSHILTKKKVDAQITKLEHVL